MNDIVVTLDENQGGFGDILFASKLVAEVKRKMLEDRQLIGDVYMVAFGQSRNFRDSLEKSRIDLEFGFNFVTTTEFNQMVQDGNVNPAVIIEAPTPTYNTIKSKNPNVHVINAREYSYGPFLKVNLGPSYENAEQTLKEAYLLGMRGDEQTRLNSYKGVEQKEIVRTGIIAGLGEKGVLMTSDLVELTRYQLDEDVDNEQRKKEDIITGMPEKMRTALFEGKEFSAYQENTELTFGYSHKSNRDFLKIHCGYIENSKKNQDIFIASPQTKSVVKSGVEAIREKLKAQGFSKIVYVDYETGEEEILHDDQSSGKVYRLIHSGGIPHPQVVALTAISGPLCLASGDQSFGEAISANKMICYETFQHKILLNSSYQSRAVALSGETQDALRTLSVVPESGTEVENIENDAKLYSLGEQLRINPTIRAEIGGINLDIIDNYSLADHFVERITSGLTNVTDNLQLMIMGGTFDNEQLANCIYPEHLHLAIRYGNLEAVTAMLKANPDCLLMPDHLGNNAFIVAAQYKQHGTILPLLIERATEMKIPFSDINTANNHIFEYTMCHYLAPQVQNNPEIRAQIFGPAYKDEVDAFMDKFNGKPPVKPKPVSLASSHCLFAPPKQEPVNIWKLLSESALETDSEPLLIATLEVVRQYLKLEQPKFGTEYQEVCKECAGISHDANWPLLHIAEYTKMLDSVRKYVSSKPELLAKIGVDWIPKPPNSLVQTMGIFFNSFMESNDGSMTEQELVNELKPFLIVIGKICKENPELLAEGDLDLLQSFAGEFKVEEDWAENNSADFASMLDEISAKLAEKPEFEPYGTTDLIEAVKSVTLGM